MHGKLGGAVKGKVWVLLSHQACYPQVLYYHSVWLQILKLSEEFFHLWKLFVRDKCVEGYIELLVLRHAKLLELSDILEREVHCPLAG